MPKDKSEIDGFGTGYDHLVARTRYSTFSYLIVLVLRPKVVVELFCEALGDLINLGELIFTCCEIVSKDLIVHLAMVEKDESD